VVVECDLVQAAQGKVWLEKAMIEGMEAVLNGMNEGHVLPPVAHYPHVAVLFTPRVAGYLHHVALLDASGPVLPSQFGQITLLFQTRGPTLCSRRFVVADEVLKIREDLAGRDCLAGETGERLLSFAWMPEID
jgi:hypothetical protein